MKLIILKDKNYLSNIYSTLDNTLVQTTPLFNKKVDDVWTPTHFYIVDENVDIQDNDYFIKMNYKGGKPTLYQEIKSAFMNSEWLNSSDVNDCFKVITTSNPSLLIPQLTKKDIDMIISKEGKIGEFDVEIKHYPVLNDTVVNIILKETYIDKINSLIQENIEHCKRINFNPGIIITDTSMVLDDKTKVIINELLKDNEVLFVEEFSSVDNNTEEAVNTLLNSRKETSTNETLEEVAKSLLYTSNGEAGICLEKTNEKCFIQGFISGANWAKEQSNKTWNTQLEATNLYYEDKITKMYSQDDISHAIAYAIHQSKLGNTHAIILEEWNKQNKK